MAYEKVRFNAPLTTTYGLRYTRAPIFFCALVILVYFAPNLKIFITLIHVVLRYIKKNPNS